MRQTKSIFKKSKRLYLQHSKFSLFVLLSIVTLMALTYNPLFDPKTVAMNELQDPLKTLESPNSKPVLVSHHATIINQYLTQSLPTNVSFTLVRGWTSKNITIYYEGISNKKDWVINGDFNSSLDPWDNLTTNVNLLIMGWNPSGYVSIRVPGGTQVAENDYAYYYENISIPELFAPGKLVTISMDYYYDGGPQAPSNVQAYVAAVIGGIEKNHTIYFPDLVRDSWTPMTINYDPANFGQELPDYLTLKAGLRGNNTAIAVGNHELFIDNVEFKIWTQPNQSNLIYAMDYEIGLNNTYQNSSFGKGETFIGVEKSYNATQNVVFTIFNNITDLLDIEIKNITITSNAICLVNTPRYPTDCSIINFYGI